MRLCLLITVAALVGAGLGIAVGVHQVRITSGDELPPVEELLRTSSASPVETSATGRPKLVVKEQEYNFGVMDASKVGRHEFVVKNAGDAPLELTAGSTSCACAVSDLKNRTVPPGQSTTVVVEWTPKDYIGKFTQSVRIETNDPLCPRVSLSVTGQITTTLGASPREVVFSRIPLGESASGETRLYCFSPDRFEPTGYEATDPATAKFFEAAFEPLSADRVRGMENAKSGYLMRVTVKSGLPQGPFRQTILVKTNLPANPTIDIQIVGTIGGDISVLGRGWNERTNTLQLGMVENQKGAERTLQLVVRGRFRETINFKVVELDPSGILEAKLGERTPIRSGLATQTPLIVRVRKGTGPANHLDSIQGKIGRIVLGTNHPQMPQLTILVSFAIDGG